MSSLVLFVVVLVCVFSLLVLSLGCSLVGVLLGCYVGDVLLVIGLVCVFSLWVLSLRVFSCVCYCGVFYRGCYLLGVLFVGVIFVVLS